MDNTLQSQLQPLREEIDRIDQDILDLLNRRAQTAQAVGQVKAAFDADGPVLKPEREASLIRHLQQLNAGPFTEAGIESVWREIISVCRGLESTLTVAYLGPQGSFSEQAALEQFGHAITKLPCASFDEVFRAVEAGNWVVSDEAQELVERQRHKRLTITLANEFLSLSPFRSKQFVVTTDDF